MKEGWEYRRFESCLIKVSKQVQVKSKDYKKEGKFPIVSQEAELISGYWDDEAIVYKHKEPVVIFGDHTKNIKYVDFDFVVGADGTHILSTKNDIVPKFFYYVLKSIKLRELGYARHYKLLKEKYIPVPPLSEQQSIVDYLDSAFANIDAMKANAGKALNEAKALFQASLKEMFEPKEGWEYKKLDVICTIVGRIGFRGYTKADLVKSSNDGAITLSPSNIIDGELVFSKCTYINWDKYYESPEIMLENGDIVLVKTASIGKCAVVKNLPHEATLNPQFVVLKQLVGVPDFICYYLKSPVAQNTIKQMAGGVAIPTLSQKKLGMMTVPTPPLSEQQSIVATLDSLKSKVDRLQANYEMISQECDALKQAILRQVFE